jgi:hypothetical protein
MIRLNGADFPPFEVEATIPYETSEVAGRFGIPATEPNR